MKKKSNNNANPLAPPLALAVKDLEKSRRASLTLETNRLIVLGHALVVLVALVVVFVAA